MPQDTYQMFNSTIVKAEENSIVCQLDALLKEKLDQTTSSIQMQTFLCRRLMWGNNRWRSGFYLLLLKQDLVNLDTKQLIHEGFNLWKEMNNKIKNDGKKQLEQFNMATKILMPFRLISMFDGNLRLRTEADIINASMETQSALIKSFLDFMKNVCDINIDLISQQTKMYELAMNNKEHTMDLLREADRIKVLNTRQLIDISFKKLEYLTVNTLEDLNYFTSNLEQLLDNL